MTNPKHAGGRRPSPPGKKLISKSIAMAPGDWAMADELAMKLEVSMAEVMRQALRAFAAKHHE